MAPPSVDAIAQAAADRWGANAARPAASTDAIDGVAPVVVLEPPDTTTLSEMLRWTNDDQLSLVPRGGGTKLGWGQSRRPVDVVLSTVLLNKPIDHCPGDLTVTVPAGARLASVNEVLARERQWLALDPRHSDRATIGGIVATNDSGPRRQRHGTPRDLIIGVEMVRADGRAAKAGGRVVKNVAGYDLARLLCGSFGSLAVITAATFKLAPVAPASRTIVAEADNARQLVALALAVAASPLSPSAIEIDSPPPKLITRIETTDAAADEHAAAVHDVCASCGASVAIFTGDAEAAIWREHADRLSSQEATILRLAVLPTQVKDMLDHIERVASRFALDVHVSGRCALGVLYVLFAGSQGILPSPEGSEVDTQREAACIEELRRNAWARGGSAVVVAAAPVVKALVDPWGDVGDSLPVMRAVKARFDPNGILSPGRGPGGI